MDHQRNSIEHDDKSAAVIEAKTNTESSCDTSDDRNVAKILRKVDYHLIPILSVLYLMSYLDRSNMGNAAIIGLKKDLKLTPAQYNLCLTVFFIPYAFFEVPSNIVLKFLRPSIWIPILIVAWGTCTTLMDIVQNYHGLLACRICLGIAEAGFFPAATYLLTNWYCRHEYQYRMSLFYASGALSGAFSGLLAYLIEKMHGVAGLEGWRWLFILEGIFTVLMGVITPFILPDSPKTAKFLSQNEKDIIENRLRADTGHSLGSYDLDEKFKASHIWAAFKDWKVYTMIVVYWGSSITVFGFIYTVPTVITELGYRASIAQLMTIPIYVVAMASVLIAARISDKLKTRSTFIIYPLIIGGVGFIALMAIPKGKYPGAIYAMLFLVAIGIYTIFCGTVAWAANNLAGPWKRAVGMALVISVGNLSGAVGTNIYLAREAPHYWTGYGVSLAVVIAAMLAACFLKIRLNRINEERDAMTEEEIRARYTDAELMDMGDESPFFRYTT